jgi:hypothetical protein
MSGNLETHMPHIIILQGEECWLAMSHFGKSVSDSCKLCILGVVTINRYDAIDRIF